MNNRILKLSAALLTAVFLILCLPLNASAESTSGDSGETTTTTSIATSPSVSLASITFDTSNSKRVEVGRSTLLYITKKNMQGSSSTVFSCSDASIARVEKESDDRCRVHGLKTGEVVITATAGGKTAKYTLYVGDESVTAASTASTSAGEVTIGTFDYFSASDEKTLSKYINDSKSNTALEYLVGIVGWAAIIGLCGLVLSVMFRNRSPKLNLYPGSRRRFNTGGVRGNQRKRLLPDHYYRNNKKY